MSKTGWIALVLLVAVVGGISYFVYDASTSGTAYLIGQVGGVFLIAVLIAALVSKRTRRPVRWDAIFAVCTAVLLISSWQKLVTAYDAWQFQHEMRAGGPGNLAETIQSSQTGMGGLMRAVVAIAEETNTKIMAVVDELDDPIFNGLLAPTNVTNRPLLRSAHDISIAKRELAKSAMLKIDRLMKAETDRVGAALGPSPDEDLRLSLLDGVNNRHTTERELYARQVDLSESSSIGWRRSRGFFSMRPAHISCHRT